MLATIRTWARRLKREVLALYLAYRDPRVPWHARVFAACVAAYALSPIDLIPDFIPVLGYLDDVILVPLGVALALRMIPPEVLDECRAKAATLAERPVSRVGAVVIACVWVVFAVLGILLLWRWLA